MNERQLIEAFQRNQRLLFLSLGGLALATVGGVAAVIVQSNPLTIIVLMALGSSMAAVKAVMKARSRLMNSINDTLSSNRAPGPE